MCLGEIRIVAKHVPTQNRPKSDSAELPTTAHISHFIRLLLNEFQTVSQSAFHRDALRYNEYLIFWSARLFLLNQLLISNSYIVQLGTWYLSYNRLYPRIRYSNLVLVRLTPRNCWRRLIANTPKVRELKPIPSSGRNRQTDIRYQPRTRGPDSAALDESSIRATNHILTQLLVLTKT